MTRTHDLLNRCLTRQRERSGRGALDIIETGSVRQSSERYRINDGWSTVAFAEHAKVHGGSVTSLDVNTDPAAQVLGRLGLDQHVELLARWSIQTLARLARDPDRGYDVVYLDSGNDAQLIFHEYLIVSTMLRTPGLVMVDDVDMTSATVVKGHAVVPWLDHTGVPYTIEPRAGDTYATGVLIAEV